MNVNWLDIFLSNYIDALEDCRNSAQMAESVRINAVCNIEARIREIVREELAKANE